MHLPIARRRESAIVGANLRRLMMELNLTQGDVSKATGLDERTLRSMLLGETRQHAKTIHKLALGLGVEAAELLRDDHALARAFDRSTNAILRVFVESRPELFYQWSKADVDDLASRFGVGGPLTEEGILAVVQLINRRRALQDKLAILFETPAREWIETSLNACYERATKVA